MPLCSSGPPLIISLHFKKLNKNLKKNKSTYWSPIIKASSPIRVTICLNLQWSFGVEKAMMQCPLNYFRTHFAAVQVQLAVVGKCICWHKWLTGKDFKAFLKYCIVRHIPHVDFLKHHSKGSRRRREFLEPEHDELSLKYMFFKNNQGRPNPLTKTLPTNYG